ncbi:MAG: hypothetical protein AB7S81_05210 [Bdellovibrionales bacterium]
MSIQAQAVPNSNLNKDSPLFLVVPSKGSVSHQKYYRMLDEILNEDGIHVVSNEAEAKYIMRVTFNDFSAQMVQIIPSAQTTYHNGIIGNTSISGTSTTIESQLIQKQIPTHNSIITVYDKKTDVPIWEASMAKSYDVYNHTELKKMIRGMISLYGKDGKTTEIIKDEFRW